ncbi:coiled-coil domain-containing protein 110 isoform X1 [Podarcis raffonei]|uniref:coiled-coil domain-containing protein 110 isoform X1 n=1 Tax=Podarcis raffonei TaxID=65483 RepID=UPI0023293386|nr:coiled-coil domain-containing protein 110 isoform X1 [Podarcis raffonei]
METRSLATPGTQECGRTGAPSFGRLREEEKGSPVGRQDASAADKSASGRDGQVQPPSALKILQQQLDSFQALRQQTLQNVSMVQSEINHILNKNITDMKSPEFIPDNLLLTSSPINTTMPRGHQEALPLKKKLHLGNRPGASNCLQTNFNTVVGKPVTGERISDQILSKYITVENHAPTCRNKGILPWNTDQILKRSANNFSSPSFVGLEAEERTLRREKKNQDEPKVCVAFRKYEEEEEEESLTESVSSSFKDTKEDGKQTCKHELFTFELQNSPNVMSGKDNDSGYLSEQDLIEKGMSYEDFKPRGISELEDSDELHIKENIAQAAYDRKQQMNFLSKYRPTKVDQPRQQLSTNQELRKHQEFCGAVSDEYAKKVRWLETSDRESEHVCNKVMSHEDENESKPLTDVIQSLTEQNSKYQKQIKDLHDEKNSLQERLVKSEEDCKECLKEVKRLLKKCKEFQQQKSALEEKQERLYSENQRMMSEINDLQQKDQKTQETLAFSTHEKSDLIVSLKNLEKQVSTLQEENKKLGGEVLQLTDNKGLLEKVVGENQNEMQQLKINEKTTLSNLEALIRMTQSLKDEKQSLEKALQEVLTVKEVLQKGLEEAQSGRTNTEEKLLMERKSTKIEIGVLKTNLSNMERECERMRMVVADMTDEKHVLKKELNAYKQEASDCRNKTRLLSEQLLLMENEIRSTENERDVLQFEARRLQKNNASLRDQVTALVDQQFKQRHNSRSQKQNDQFADPSEICEEISSYQHISLIHNSPECGKISEIRKKLEEEELYTEKKRNTTKKLYSAFSVSCTTSVIKESGFPTAVRKKYSSICSAT